MTETNRIEFKRELTRDLDIEREVVAFPRNKELMRVFRDVDLVESLGSGMRRIQKVNSRAVYVFLPNFIRVSIPFYSQKRTNSDNEDALIGSLTDDFGNVKSGATTKEIISKLNVSERTIYRELAALKQMGHIRRVGSDKTGHWEVIRTNEE